MTKKVIVEMVNDPTTKTDGRKITERKYVEVERDLTILKDPVSFITRIIQEHGIYPSDAMKMISIDGGDNSMKFILNVFDRNQDSEITFPKVEKKGNLCSGVNRSIVLAYCEDLEENYSNCRILMELLRVDELDSVIAADYKLLNILLGLSSHGGKFACIYCEASKGLEVGITRT